MVARDLAKPKPLPHSAQSAQSAQAAQPQDSQSAHTANGHADLQTAFLRHVCKHRNPLTVFLVNGVKLEGVVTDFDGRCFTLMRNRHTQLVYKHSVSTIMPLAEVHLLDGETKPLRPQHA